MRCNEKVAVSTSKVLLVPYSKHHVLRYHEWMQDPDIQAATASEPLTLEQEYAMQQSWRHDSDKLTFIVCHPLTPNDADSEPKQIQPQIYDNPDRMIGDVNMFLSIVEIDSPDDSLPSLVGEIELLIAFPKHRGKGYGWAVLLAFFQYIARHHDEIVAAFADASFDRDRMHGRGLLLPPRIDHLRAKINQTNTPSLALFRKVGFVSVSDRANYWGEVELRLPFARLDVLLAGGDGIGSGSELEYHDNKDVLEAQE